MREPAFSVVNLGCKVNRVESDSIASELIAAGATFVDVPAGDSTRDADVGSVGVPSPRVVVVNTCTVTGEAEKKARKTVHHVLRSCPDATVLVTGCAAAIDPGEYESMSSRVVVESDKLSVPGIAREILGLDAEAGGAVRGGTSVEPAAAAHFLRAGDGFMQRAGIKVQDGCANACTYCIVHVARGPLWSRPEHEVIAEVASAEAAGVREVVLTGVNLGRYDDGGVRIADLLGRLLESTSLLRIRLSSIEPPDIDDRLLSLMAASDGRICRHLHLPLQSGCDKTLRQMGRRYSADAFSRLVGSMRAAMPQIALSTDVIVGFPGETDADFEESMAFCAQMAFSKMHVFRYSRRPGTPAAARSDQVPPEVKAARSDALRALAYRLRCDYAASRVRAAEKVLVERLDGRTATGTSESYLDVLLEADGAAGAREGGPCGVCEGGPCGVCEGALMDVRFAASDGEKLVGIVDAQDAGATSR